MKIKCLVLSKLGKITIQLAKVNAKQTKLGSDKDLGKSDFYTPQISMFKYTGEHTGLHKERRSEILYFAEPWVDLESAELGKGRRWIANAEISPLYVLAATLGS